MEQTVIGEGSYGIVYQKNKSDTVNKYSFWVTQNSTGERYLVPSTLREVCFYQLMRRASNQPDYSFLKNPPPSINRAKSVTRKEGSVVISQRYRGRRLTRVFDDERTRENFQRIFSGVIQGLAWLHSFGCSHGDIKADNILVDLHMNAALIDFGSCSFFHHQIFTQNAPRCTITTVAPEEILHKRWTLASDIWSLGVVMFEFLTKRTFVIEVMEAIGAKSVADKWQHLVFKEPNSANMLEAEELLKNLFTVSTTPNGIKTAILTHIGDKDIQDLLTGMLVVDRRSRPKADDILGMKFFSADGEKFRKWDPASVANNGIMEYNEVSLPKIPALDRQIALQFMSLMVNMPKSPFAKTWFGHAAMLFDRWMFRAAAKRTLPQNLSPQVVAVLAITGCILNPHYMAVEALAVHAKCSGDELEHVMGEILDDLHWNCFNWSPDLLLLIKTGRYPSTKVQLQVYQQLPIFSDGSASVGDIIHEVRSANE